MGWPKAFWKRRQYFVAAYRRIFDDIQLYNANAFLRFEAISGSTPPLRQLQRNLFRWRGGGDWNPLSEFGIFPSCETACVDISISAVHNLHERIIWYADVICSTKVN